MNIIRIPVLTDNYVFLICDRNTNEIAVVDPAVSEPVLAEIEKLGGKLTAILNTHHHLDHVGEIKNYYNIFPKQ